MKTTQEIVIRPRSGWSALDLGEVWRRRDLVWIFGWRDVSVRYKQTALGIVWALVQPLMMMIVFSVVFGRFAKIPSDGHPYPIFSYSGLLPWIFFASSVSAIGNSVVANAQLVTKAYIPRLILPIAACVPPFVDFVVAFVILIGMMIWYGVTPTPAVILLPALLLWATLTALAIGIWVAVLNVYYRDFRYILPFIVQLLMFLSPVIYPLSFVDETMRQILLLNPMVGVIEGFRWALLGGAEPNWENVAISVLVTFVVLLGALLFFRRMEARFADVI
jgi:homopolymeric O-antigen transport system permease protein